MPRTREEDREKKMINAVSIAIVSMFAAFATVDFLLPARRLPGIRLWRAKGILSLLAYLAIAFNTPALWDGWLAQRTLFNASALPLWAQIAIGFVALEAFVFAWHRAMHAIDPLWRHLHQMHHSAERIDIWSAFWFHPLDVVGFSFIGSLALVGGVGLQVEAATAVNILAAFCSIFTHANIKTPRWIGYVITRPESHALHHARGQHRYNYGDVPWFDMLFGSFRNPERAPDETGFFDGASGKLWSLLIGRKLA